MKERVRLMAVWKGDRWNSPCIMAIAESSAERPILEVPMPTIMWQFDVVGDRWRTIMRGPDLIRAEWWDAVEE